MSGAGRGRRTAEWVTFGISLAVVLAVLAGVAALMAGPLGESPPRFAVAVVEVAPSGADHHVRVRVRNEGGRTAEQVQVLASLALPGGAGAEAEQQVPFLAPGAEEEVVFVFAGDPARGRLDVRVGSYAVP